MLFDGTFKHEVTKCRFDFPKSFFPIFGKLVFVAVTSLIPSAIATAKEYQLVQGPHTDSQIVKTVMEVSGKVKLNPDGKKIKEFPMNLNAELLYHERQLGSKYPVTAVRKYREAKAEMMINNQKTNQVLPHERAIISVDLKSAKPDFFSPYGNLKREEIDLINVPGNSLLLNQLLPQKSVKVGDSWKFKNEQLVGLFCLDAISANDVESKLVNVKDDLAMMELKGSISGAVTGVATEIKLRGKLNFDLQKQAIQWVAFAIEEDRSIGHTAPGFKVTAVLKMLIEPRSLPDSLNDQSLSKLELTPDLGKKMIALKSETGFRLMHAPAWHVLSENQKRTVFRFVKQGELIAQCNIMRMPSLKAGEHMTLEAYQQEVQKALGDNFGQIVDAGQKVTTAGLRELRVSVTGTASELPITWIYYLFSNDHGQRYSVVFTYETQLEPKFAEADRLVVSSFEILPEQQPKQAAQEEVQSATKDEDKTLK